MSDNALELRSTPVWRSPRAIAATLVCVAIACFVISWVTDSEGRRTANLLQVVVSSLAIGSLYALISLGYTMVYGILRFINFAHSDIVVWGAWLSYTFATFLQKKSGTETGAVPLWMIPLVVTLAAVSCGALGFLIERVCYRPLRNVARINVLIAAIGVSLLLQNVGQLPFVFGSTPEKMPPLLPDSTFCTIRCGGDNHVAISQIDLIIFATAAVLMVGLEAMVHHTRLGMAMRAVSFNSQTAALMGIPVDRVISFTFVLGSMMAAIAGFLYAAKYGTVQQPAHAIWVLLGLKAFVAAVVGGIGNIRGAVLGGFLIAAVEQGGRFYVSTNYSDVFVFGLLILTLLVKPTGLLGVPAQEKV